MSGGINRYKVLVVGKNGKLNETIEGSALWSIPLQDLYETFIALKVTFHAGDLSVVKVL